MAASTNQLTESTHAHGYDDYQRMAFFTDTSVCIGCKACEVACKEWNRNPVEGYNLTGNSYDNTGALGANTWRHVAFIEQDNERITKAREEGAKLVSLACRRLALRLPMPQLPPRPPTPPLLTPIPSAG